MNLYRKVFELKKEILKQFSGKYCTIDEIVSYIETVKPMLSRKAVIWNINELVKRGTVTRVGRGVYCFAEKKKFQMMLSNTAKRQ